MQLLNFVNSVDSVLNILYVVHYIKLRTYNMYISTVYMHLHKETNYIHLPIHLLTLYIHVYMYGEPL